MSVTSFYPQARAILQVVLDGYGSDDADSDTLIIPVLPKAVTVHINSYRQADSWELTIDAHDLPIDPKLIRAGSVEIFVFQTTGVKDGLTSLSREDPLADPDPGGVRPRGDLDTALLESQIPIARDKFTLGNKPRIAGLFDDGDLEMSESGKWVTISGQDYTAHLASIQYPPNPDGTARRIPTGQRLDDFVGDLIASADPTGALGVDVRGIEDKDLPIVGANETRSTTRGIPVEQNTTYWDVIYKTVERHGLITYVSGLDVVITRPKILTDQNASSVKRLTWGKNLSHLNLKRHLGKEQAPTIILRSYDPKSKKTISVEYPENGTIDRSIIIDSKSTRKGSHKVHANVKQSTHVSKTGKVKTTLRQRDEYRIDTVYGITDKATLSKMAENRYHLLGRAERTVIAKTRDLKIETPNGLADILSMEAGDAFEVKWADFNREIMADPSVTEAKKADYLVRRGFNREIANQIARHYGVLDGLDRPLRFKEGTITYDVDQGIDVEMELQDFIVIDGIRPDQGATRESRTDRNHAALTKSNGERLGGSAAKRLGGA